MIWKTRRHAMDLTRSAQVMGVLNVTPDSFSDGGQHADLDAAMDHARQMIAEGVGVIDIGGESTRPGAAPVSVVDEIQRTAPVIAALRNEWDGLISIDTSKAAVAEAALEAGADIVNDVTGLSGDPAMMAVCAESACGICIMHMQGNPQTMQQAPRYEDVMAEVRAFFTERLDAATAAGIDADHLCFDPGIGFGKSLDHNLTLIRNIDALAPAGRPILLGVSRKSFIGKVLGDDDMSLRDWPTVAITAQSREKGVMLHRVHDVKRNVEALRMVEAIMHG